RPGDAAHPSGGWLPNPLDESAEPITFRAWARLLNFKANQRKVVIADDGRDGLVAVVGSANVHDASSAHSNAALKVTGAAIIPLLNSELDIARFSGWRGSLETAPEQSDPPDPAPGTGSARVKVLTEGAIRTELLRRLDSVGRGDNVDVAMFYI